jgi:hypothetical protein
MSDPIAYAKHIRKLREHLMRASGLAVLELPEQLDENSGFAKSGGSAHDNSQIRGLAQEIDAALRQFGEVQKAVGLHGDDPRFQWFLDGHCRECGKPIEPPKTTQKPTTKKKGKP